MVRALHSTLLLIPLICIMHTVHGQDKKNISGSFTGYTFPRLVDYLEQNTAFTFYYDPAETDSILIDIQVTNVSLRQLLDQVFQGTALHYAIDTSGRVFISNRVAIRTALPPGFFRHDRDTIAATPTEEGNPAQKTVFKASEEFQLIPIGDKSSRSATGKASVAGYIRDVATGEAIVGAFLVVDTPAISAVTDQFGYYSLSLPKGRHNIRITSQGMTPTRRQIQLYSDGKLDINLKEFVASLKAVTVTAEKTSNTRSLQMGVNRLSISTIKQVPAAFGEADVLKVVLTLPGVTSAGEASNGFNVRGGSVDQNLILLDDATIYNPAHLFGFFSAFNPDIVKGIELYKSAIPEKYGGRLSSVLDVSMLDGNNKKWAGNVGIGPLTSKIFLQGPLKKEKTTLVLGFRSTYSDWLLKNIPNSAYSNSSANFYDANLRLTHIIDSKNTLYLMGYASKDKFNFNNDTTYRYSNKNANIKWKHFFSNSSYALFTAGIDRYDYSISDAKDSIDAFKLGFDIRQTYFRADFTYNPGNKHSINYGVSSIYYQLHPGYYDPVGPHSLVVPNTVQAEQGLESALHLGDQYAVSSRLSVSAGLRFSLFNYLGPHDVYDYAPGQPRQINTIVDTTIYGNNKVIKTYSAPEIRLSARYSLPGEASIKFSYNTLQQYIHMLSNTVTVSPTDIWKLSDPSIKPQSGDQFSLGYYRNLKSNTIELSIEVYYKRLKNYLDYKSGSELVLNHHIETEVFTTRGKAYGAELLIKKTAGRLNGWLSYTFSRTFLRQDDPLAGELVNKGKFYPAGFDKPHAVNFIGNYALSHRYSFSLNIVYSTGRPITLPLAVFNLGGSPGLFYSQRNAYRIPDYFRSDFSVNIDGNHKVKKRTHNSWSAGIYNLTGRENAYSVYFTQENGLIKGYKLSILGTPIPFVTYNLKF
ncbi:MAG TPA: TonB-dependent receptor [Puia sp.]|nr:TonB-dependent receptor [Puia sp.]